MIDKIEGKILETDLDSNFNEIIFSMLANKINELIDKVNELSDRSTCHCSKKDN